LADITRHEMSLIGNTTRRWGSVYLHLPSNAGASNMWPTSLFYMALGWFCSNYWKGSISTLDNLLYFLCDDFYGN